MASAEGVSQNRVCALRDCPLCARCAGLRTEISRICGTSAQGALPAIDATMLRATAVRRFAAVPIVPIIGAFLAKKAVASYAIFNAVHSYGIPKLFRQVAHATRAWGVDAAARREFLYLVKGALRALTSAYSFVENSFAARVVAHVAQNPELRAELNKRVPPVIVEALQSAVRRTPVGKAFDAALGVLEKVRPKT